MKAVLVRRETRRIRKSWPWRRFGGDPSWAGRNDLTQASQSRAPGGDDNYSASTRLAAQIHSIPAIRLSPRARRDEGDCTQAAERQGRGLGDSGQPPLHRDRLERPPAVGAVVA